MASGVCLCSSSFSSSVMLTATPSTDIVVVSVVVVVDVSTGADEDVPSAEEASSEPDLALVLDTGVLSRADDEPVDSICSRSSFSSG